MARVPLCLVHSQIASQLADAQCIDLDISLGSITNKHQHQPAISIISMPSHDTIYPRMYVYAIDVVELPYGGVNEIILAS